MSREATFLQEGNVINWHNGSGSDVSAGAFVPLGDNLLGVALVDIASTATGAVKMSGVFKADAVSNASFAVGDILYWDDTNSKLTKLVGASGTIAAPESGNTGDADISEVVVTPDSDAPEDVFTLVCTDKTTPGSEVWSVIGAGSGQFDDLVTAVAYGTGADHAPFGVTIPAADGEETAWDVGDILTITISQANTYAGKCVLAKLTAGTTGNVLLNA